MNVKPTASSSHTVAGSNRPTLARLARPRALLLSISGLALVAAASALAVGILTCGPASSATTVLQPGNGLVATTAPTPSGQEVARDLKRQLKAWEHAWEAGKPGKRAEAFSRVYVAADAMSALATRDSFQPRRFESVRIGEVRVAGDTAWATLQVSEKVPGAQIAQEQRVQQVWLRTDGGWRIQLERFDPLESIPLGVTPY